MKSPGSRAHKLDFQRGKRALRKHDVGLAISFFNTAVDDCPPSERSALARRLYWLSLALKRIGKDGLALKALSTAQRLTPRGYARSMYKRLANDYGMPRSSCTEHDDYRAFCSIHIRRYLETMPDRSFSSKEESDQVLTILADAWVRLGLSSTMSGLDCNERLRQFREASIIFPRLQAATDVTPGKIIDVNFYKGRLMNADDRCSCGSGLAYRVCCGRIRLPYEKERA